VRFHRTGYKKLHHPVVGELELNFEAMELPSAPGLTLLVYTAPAGSPTSDSLKLLASWTATTEQNDELAQHCAPPGPNPRSNPSHVCHLVRRGARANRQGR
jgi:MmyB-like transcription regulator ligand binding domain